MKFTLFILTFLTFCSLTLRAQNQEFNNDTTKVIVLSLNDQHAKIDNYPQLKAMVDRIRLENKDVFLFSAGDNFTGNPVVDQYPEKGFPVIDLMNLTGFNATAIGNHEFDYGQQTLNKRMLQADFPFLSANIKDQSNNLKFRPYKLFVLSNGQRLCVVSAVQLGSGGIPDSHPANLKNLVFTDGISELKKLSNLRDSCMIFIALTHLGFEKDIELANAMPQFDLIIGGHTHTLTKPAQLANGVTITQAGSNLRNLSKVTFYIVRNTIVKTTPEMLSISSYPDKDETIIQKLAVYNDNDELNRVIGTNSTPLKGSDELGSLMTDAVTALESVDVAFQNNGGIRIDYLNAGPITVKDVYKLDPFGNEVIVYKLKVKEIKSLILNSFLKAENDIDLQVSGLTYTVILNKDKQPVDIQLQMPDGRRISKCRTFKVGLNSYIASSYTFDHKDPGKSLYITTAQCLINFISEKKEVSYKGIKRALVK